MDGDGVHDIFVGAFSAKPFKLQGFELAAKGTTKAKNKYTYQNDERAEPFLAHRKHIEVRRPPVALLIATDSALQTTSPADHKSTPTRKQEMLPDLVQDFCVPHRATKVTN